MDDIGHWLEDQGLGKYRDLFEDNEVAFSDLRLITEDDIRELGLPLGPRRRLLAALEVLRSEADSSANETVERPEQALSGDAERRQLTVMFSDLVGSTSLSESMDPEDYRDLLGAYQSAAGAAIQSHDGYIARYMGDGLLVYFGYPVAQENDAERSARAGLAVVDAVAALESPVPLQVRVGIATGPVVVGDIVGEGASEEAAVLGETPNLAARLQGAAAPNTVVLSSTTQKLLKGRLETEALAVVQLKGISRPILPYRAVRTRPLFEVNESTRDASPLVGREVDLALLQRAWVHARSSDGRGVLLTGEPGVGKSRLLRVFQQTIGDHNHISVHWHCSPHHQSTANYPFIEQLKRSVRFDKCSPDAVLDALSLMLGDVGLARKEFLPALAFLLSLPADMRSELPPMPPDALKRLLISTQVRLLLADARRAPLVFIIEDLHWADPTTLEVLGEIVASIGDAPVLMLMTARPGFTPGWTGHAHALVHGLNTLSRNETMELVRGIANERGLRPDLVEQIVERTDGVPLFVEELTKELLESGDDGNVPASIQDSLMARLDRLGESKELAQVASVIGREFSLDVLRSLTQLSSGMVEQRLSRLIAAGLVNRQAGGSYEFKHALVVETAYGSLLRARRRAIHLRFAATLQEDVTNGTDVDSALVAHHLVAGGDPRRAWPHWQRAGQRAAERYANAEAAQFFSFALEALPKADSIDRLELLCAREHAYDVIGDRSAQAADLDAIAGLADDMNSPAARAEALLRRAKYFEVTTDFASSVSAAKQAAKESNAAADDTLRARSQLQWGRTHWRKSQWLEAQPHLEAALSLARSSRLPLIESDALRLLASIWTNSGAFAKALAAHKQVVPICRQMGDLEGEGVAYMNISSAFFGAGRFDESRASQEKGLELFRSIGNRWRESMGLEICGRRLIRFGDLGAARQLLDDGASLSRKIGNVWSEWRARMGMGQLAREVGDYVRAKDLLTAALVKFEEMDYQRGISEAAIELSLVMRALGCYRRSEELAIQAQACEETNKAEHYTDSLIARARAAAASENLVAAREIYCAALEARTRLGQLHLVAESLSALAWIDCQRGDCVTSAQFANEAAQRLETFRPDGFREPGAVYLTCFDVLSALGEESAKRIHVLGRATLERRCATINDEAHAHSFKYDVPSHRALLT